MKHQKIVSAAHPETAAVHLSQGGFPPHPGRRAVEYVQTDRPLTCNPCKELAEEIDGADRIEAGVIAGMELDDSSISEPDSSGFSVEFEYTDPVTKAVTIIKVADVDADSPVAAIERAVEERMKITVRQQNMWVFPPTD